MIITASTTTVHVRVIVIWHITHSVSRCGELRCGKAQHVVLR